ncbi:MAG: hypothetical protein FD123_712 [Bacteroidetes bacterium]|nr:MAG: hypothetical protein FD123_712 [Bacteroidota bacterium]
MKKMYRLSSIVLLFSCTAGAQTINLDWVQTETYPQENANAVFAFDKSNNDIVSGILNVWVDVNNQIHANALNRRNQSGQMVYDSLFDNNSYLDYRLRGFYPKNGEIYYCLGFQNNQLFFEKMGTSGQLLWQQSLPVSNAFFPHERNLKGNSWVIDDSLNNRMLWGYEQWDFSVGAKNVGILATDNATGNITIIDTLSYSGVSNYTAFAFEIQRDNNNHIYLSSTDENGRALISLLDNGQFVTEVIIDSAGFSDYPQSMRIVGNTMYFTSQTNINSNDRSGKLTIYSIDNAGHLTLIGTQYLSDSQDYIPGIKVFGNNCYVFTSCYQNITNPALTPVIWKYDNAGNLINTFTLSSFTGKSIIDLAITSKAIYCSMYTPGFDQLEIIHPLTGLHLGNYNLLNEFSAIANDGALQVEALSAGPMTDRIFVAGNQWISQDLFARLARYSFTIPKNGIDDPSHDSMLSLFPNPAGDAAWLDYKGEGRYTVSVTDLRGRLLMKQEGETSRQLLDLSGLCSGVYMLLVQDEQRIAVKRFVKK